MSERDGLLGRAATESGSAAHEVAPVLVCPCTTPPTEMSRVAVRACIERRGHVVDVWRCPACGRDWASRPRPAGEGGR